MTFTLGIFTLSTFRLLKFSWVGKAAIFLGLSAWLVSFSTAAGLGQSEEPSQATAEVASESEAAKAVADRSAGADHSGDADHSGGHGAADGHEQESHGHEGDHGHDPVHANLSDSAEDPAEWRSDMAIASLVIFTCLLTGLAMVAWKPISDGLQKREKSIANSIDNAERASKEAMDKLRQYEAKLAEASAEAQRILVDARKDAEVAGQRLIDAAQEEAANQRKRALADIESAKTVALNELAEKSTDVALTLASRIVGREVKAGDHQSMIQEMLTKLPSQN